MTVESNYAILIATLSGSLKNLTPVFQSVRGKTKTNRTLTLCAQFFPHFAQVSSICWEL